MNVTKVGLEMATSVQIYVLRSRMKTAQKLHNVEKLKQKSRIPAFPKDISVFVIKEFRNEPDCY